MCDLLTLRLRATRQLLKTDLALLTVLMARVCEVWKNQGMTKMEMLRETQG